MANSLRSSGTTPVAAPAAGASGPDLRVILCVSFKRDAPPDQLSALKAAVISCESVLHAVEVTGTFDFLLELSVPDIATFKERLKLIAPSSLVRRYEVNFVSRRFRRKVRQDRGIWVQCDDGLVRIDCSEINKITAEGDYMRIHTADRSWLIHATMHSLVERLEASDFIQIHRSTIVRSDFIDRLVHDQGRWVARLQDGSRQTVAKSHVVETLKHLRAH